MSDVLREALKTIANIGSGEAQRVALDALRATEKPVDLATDIPMDDCGLHINSGRDGTWLHFSASTGLCASVNVNCMAAERGNIIGGALHDWCSDRHKQAAQIRSDNGQFGVGA